MKNVLTSLGFDEDEIEMLEQPYARQRRRWRYRNIASCSYLLLSVVSPRVPGPGLWLGLAPHIRLFHGAAVYAAMFWHTGAALTR